MEIKDGIRSWGNSATVCPKPFLFFFDEAEVGSVQEIAIHVLLLFAVTTLLQTDVSVSPLRIAALSISYHNQS